MLNLSENKNKLKIAITFVAIVVLLIFIIPIVLVSRENNNDLPPLTPEKLIPSSSEIDQNKPEVLNIKQKIIDSKIEEINGDYIVTSNDKYRVTYVPPLKIFFVSILREPVQDIKEESEEYFKNFGLSQEDLCTLPVRFAIPDITLKNSHRDFNFLPKGCV